MDAIGRFFKRFGMLLRRQKFNSELDEEMSFHREQKEMELLEAGAAPEAAHHAAMREFGNATRLKEQSHEVVGFHFETVWQDLHFALRQLRRSPGFTLTAILMLALGIGASLSIFAFVDAALIKPLPYGNPNRLVDVSERSAVFPRSNLSYLDYVDWKRLNKVFNSLDVYTGFSYLLSTPAGTEPVPATRVSDGFFRTLGVRPILGRDFYSGEDQPNAAAVVILSYGTWQTRFGGRQNVIGETVTLSGKPNTIIGVLPVDFQFAPRGSSELWTTLHELSNCEQRRSCHNLFGVARLKDGVSVETALADMTSIAKQLEIQFPDSNRDQGAQVAPLSALIVKDIRPILLALLGGTGLLLLIACINVASLLLVRSEGRRREFAVRGALGASRGRLIRQFVTEGLVLVAAGTLCGVAAGYGAMQVLLHLISKDLLRNMPYLANMSFNVHVVVFAAALAVFAAVIFSITPVFRLPLTELRESLTDGARGAAGTLWRRFGANLVVIELTIAVVLLVSAGLLGKSFYRLLHVDLSFEPNHLATMQLALPSITYDKDEKLVEVTKKILDRVATLPGVTSASTASMLPVTCNCNTNWIRVVGHPFHGEHNEIDGRQVSTNYFKTLKAGLVRGRTFTDQDDASKPNVSIINKALAEKYFPGEDPIGHKIASNTLDPKSFREVVGIVDNVRESALDSEIWPAEYTPLTRTRTPIIRSSFAPRMTRNLCCPH